MPEQLSSLFDLKTLAFVALIGGSNVGQYLGIVAPAKEDTRTSIEMVRESQGAALEAQQRVAVLQALLDECQQRCIRR